MKIGYARVSTDDQSLALQLDALRAAGARNPRGEGFGRPERSQRSDGALKGCAAGDVLVVWKLDRLPS